MPLKYDEETISRMTEMSKHRKDLAKQTDEQKEARNRMALFPSGEKAEVLFTSPELWVVSYTGLVLRRWC